MSRPRPTIPSLLLRPARFGRLAALAISIAPLASIPKASAYVYEAGSPRWASGNVTFVLSLGSPSRTLSDGSTSWNAPGSAALSIWNQYMQSVHLVGVVNDSAPVSDHDGVNSVAFASTFFGSSFGSNTLAITGYYYGGGRMTEADVLVNNRQSWDSYRGALRFGSGWDLRRVLIHELGHALGLDHPDQHGQHVAAVMNSVISDIDTAVQDDINGIQSIYGAGTGGGATPTPTPTPTPNPTATPQPTATPIPTATPSAAAVGISVDKTFIHPGETATFTVSISTASNAPVAVNYFVGGRANRSMFTLSGVPGQVVIQPGATSATFTLTANSAARRPRTVTIYLGYGSAYSISRVARGASVTISR